MFLSWDRSESIIIYYVVSTACHLVGPMVVGEFEIESIMHVLQYFVDIKTCNR